MSDLAPLVVRIAVPSPLRRVFDYLVPEHVLKDNPEAKAEVGCRVLVTFGRREMTGLIVGTGTTSEFDINKLKPVGRLLDCSSLLPESLFNLFVWAANYYQHPIGDALLSTLPTLLRKGDPLPETSRRFWQLTTKGKVLGPTSLKGAPSQQPLTDELQNKGKVDDVQLVAAYSRSILSALEEKKLIEAVMVETPPHSLDNILKEDALTLDSGQQQAINSIEDHGFNAYLLDGVNGSGKTEIYLPAI